MSPFPHRKNSRIVESYWIVQKEDFKSWKIYWVVLAVSCLRNHRLFFWKPSSVWNSNPVGKVGIIFRFFPLSDFPQCQPDSSIINQPVSRDRGHQTKVTPSIIEIDILQQSISWWQLMIPCMINVNQSSLWLI